MKKTALFFIAALVCAGCQMKDPMPENTIEDKSEGQIDNGQYKVVAKLSEVTRVSITDAGKAAWQADDKIALYDGTQFVAFDLVNAETGEFSGPAGTYTGLAVYPAPAAGGYGWSVNGSGELIMDMPSTYTFSVNQTSAPMIAEASGDTFYFRAVTGLFKFSFSNVSSGAREFRFSTSEKVNGSFNLGVPAPGTTICGIEGAATDGEKAVIITIPESAVASNMVFYVPAPVTNDGRKYAGFSITISNQGVPYAEVSSAKVWTLDRLQMRRFKEVDCNSSLPDKLYMVGDCLDEGWNFSESQALTKTAPGIYRANNVHITKPDGWGDAGFKIFFNNDWSATWLSYDDKNSGYTSGSGFADITIIGGEYYKARESAGDTQIYLNGRGYYYPNYYDLEVNLNTRKLSVTPHKIFYVGGCVDSWSLTDSQTLTQTSPGIYEGDITIKNVEDWNGLQFYSMPDYWGPSWASDGNTLNIISREAYKAAHDNEDPQFRPLQMGYSAGNYHLTLNFNTMKITLE